MEALERMRVAERQHKIGHAGLQDFDNHLKAAKSLYDKKIPVAVLTSVPLPSIDAIEMPGVVNKRNFHPEVLNNATVTAKSGVDAVDVNSLHVPFQYSAINGSFADILASITTQVRGMRKPDV